MVQFRAENLNTHMFDFLKRNQPPSSKQIDKVVKKLTEPQGEDAPRIEAAQRLSEWGTPDALYALLKRFTISSKVITQDIEEKRMIVRMLVERGEEAVEPILRFLGTHHQVEWPIQALSEILPREQLIPKLVGALEKVASASAFTPPEHKSDLIRAMRGHVTPEIAAVLKQFLSDDDDDVRIAAIDAIAEVGEEVREPLLEAFLETDDRPRIRIRIAEIFADHDWAVKGYRPRVEQSLPEGFHITAKGLIRRR
jgi:HEAT repeat protein